MKKLIIVFTVFLLFSCLDNDLSIKQGIKALCEYAYMEGQIDALEGEYNIMYDAEKQDWCWDSCPWDDIDTTVFMYYEEYQTVIDEANLNE